MFNYPESFNFSGKARPSAESVDVGKWQDPWMARAICGCREMAGGPSVDLWMTRNS